MLLADGAIPPAAVHRPERENRMTTEPSSPSAPSTESNQLRPEILAILRRPVTRSPLRQDGDWLIAEVGGLSYPVRMESR